MKRIKLCDRKLPCYSRGEECMNMVTHIVGGAIGLLALVLCLLRASTPGGYVGSVIYGVSMVTLYSISSVYHGLRPSTGKKVMQIIDHCMIYFLIAGTYTVLMLTAMVPHYPLIGWGMLVLQWALLALAVTLTAIDLHKYQVFSMICYIGMGWGIIAFIPQTVEVLTRPGFGLLLWGGIVYTIGAVLYGIGAKKRWMHSVFHIFVVLGSVLQLLAIVLYAF